MSGASPAVHNPPQLPFVAGPRAPMPVGGGGGPLLSEAEEAAVVWASGLLFRSMGSSTGAGVIAAWRELTGRGNRAMIEMAGLLKAEAESGSGGGCDNTDKAVNVLVQLASSG